MAPIGLSSGEAILVIALAAIPVAVLVFALGAGGAFRQIGKGPMSIEQEPRPRGGGAAPISAAAREDEIRQMLEAKAYRQRGRGEQPIDVEAEVERLLDEAPGRGLRSDPELVAEVRQLVVARNERRERQGKAPLDVEAEIAAQLRRLEDER